MIALVTVVVLSAITAGNVLLFRELLRRRDRELERVMRSFEQERQQLLDRIMYMARTPWGEPPFEEPLSDYRPVEFVYPEVTEFTE